MHKIILYASLFSILSACQAQPSENQNIQNHIEMNNSTAKTAIESLLFSYRDALNASSTAQVLPLYTRDGVFMPTGAPSAIGQEQVKGAYDAVFANIRLSIEFYIDEIVVDGDYAFARYMFNKMQ